MASAIDISGLTLTPKIAEKVSEIVFAEVFQSPSLTELHKVYTKIKLKTQILIGKQLGLTGVKPVDCSHGSSGSKLVLSEKFWDPAKIEDEIVHCGGDVDELFAVYFDDINRYTEIYNITGKPIEKLLIAIFVRSAKLAIERLIWFGDTAAAAATGVAEGLISVGDVKFFDPFDGIWKQIFSGVAAASMKRVTITENALATKAAQLALPAKAASGYMQACINAATADQRQDKSNILYVSHELYENYTNELYAYTTNFEIKTLQNGLPYVMYKSYKVVDMDTIWKYATDYFALTSADTAYFLPNRIVFSTPDNLPVGTLSDKDFDEVDSFYDKTDKTQIMRYGFTLDSKVLLDDNIVVAY